MHWCVRSLVIALTLYPIVAALLVYVVVTMESSLGMRGAKLGSFSTPLGIIFNVSAVLTIGFLLWAPAGFVASFFTARAINRPEKASLFPALYLLACISAFFLAQIDPGGYFTYYFD
ncbi:hypothetical protein Poly51_49320 [Rubripirellula tenax]|uniref:Uncharacterized protein n=2 Tax=Rubripirellula tenax TaxID=2528015 RepID=A0A5C6EJP0_9BACT|nr:hypothetical protein Poly51_49320 [Rubripirellula tenax]